MNPAIQAQDALAREAEIRRRVRRLAEFYRHLAVFMVFMVPVWTISVIIAYFWPGFVKNALLYVGGFLTIGWAIGLVCHAITVLPFWNFLSQDWEDRKVREILARSDKGAAK